MFNNDLINNKFILVHRLSPLNMPDYAEVAGCSSFKNSSSPTYDSFGAYASTTLVGRQYPKNSYSAPNSVHYNNFINSTMAANGKHQQQFALNGSISMSNDAGPMKMNIIENKMEQMLNNLNNPTSTTSQLSLSMNQRQQQQGIQHQMKSNGSKSVPQTPFLSSMRRNRHLFNNNNNSNSSKLSSSFVDAEQPLFMKSKFDESWSSIPSTTALTDSTTTSNNNSPSHLASSSYHASPFRSPHHLQSSLNQLNNADGIGTGMGNGKAGSNLLIGNSYLSSFGKSDKV